MAVDMWEAGITLQTYPLVEDLGGPGFFFFEGLLDRSHRYDQDWLEG